MDGNPIPTFAKVIAVFYYILTAIFVIMGISMFVGSGFVSSILSSQVGGVELETLSAIGTGVLIFIGIVFLAFAVLDFFVAKGMWQGKNWARIVVIIFSVLGVIIGLITLPTGILNLIINAVFAGYLLFSKEAKSAFTGQSSSNA